MITSFDWALIKPTHQIFILLAYGVYFIYHHTLPNHDSFTSHCLSLRLTIVNGISLGLTLGILASSFFIVPPLRFQLFSSFTWCLCVFFSRLLWLTFNNVFYLAFISLDDCSTSSESLLSKHYPIKVSLYILILSQSILHHSSSII